MPLYIRNEEASELADRLARLTGKNKSDAVVSALREAISRQQKVVGIEDQIAELQALVKADGFRKMADQKEFDDDLSGNL